MSRNPVPHRLSLAAGGYAVLADARGTRIVCAAGVLWITQYTDLRDIVLQAGQSFVIDRDTRVIVSAVSDADFGVVPPPAPVSRLGRARRWLLGEAGGSTLRLAAGSRRA